MPDIINKIIKNEFQEISPSNIGLDHRSASRLWVSEDWIAVKNHELDLLTYYGGFEYVDEEFIMFMGSFVLFSVEDVWVAQHISYLFDTDNGGKE